LSNEVLVPKFFFPKGFGIAQEGDEDKEANKV